MKEPSSFTPSRPTPVGRYIDLYRELCGTTPTLNNQECEVIRRLVEECVWEAFGAGLGSAPSETPRTFSDFIRNATPEEKEEVYAEVMMKASARQLDATAPTVNTIKRYEMENIGYHGDDNFAMVEDPDGEYVKYEDAVHLRSSAPSARNAQALPCQPVDPKEVAFNASLAPPTADALQEAYHEGYNDALEDMGVGNGK